MLLQQIPRNTNIHWTKIGKQSVNVVSVTPNAKKYQHWTKTGKPIGKCCYTKCQEIPLLDLNWQTIGTCCYTKCQEIPILDLNWQNIGN